MAKLTLFALIAMLMVVAPPALGQEDPKCVTELDACGPFINSTIAKPPSECCTPLKSVLKNEIPCLCGIFSNRDLIQSLSLNVTEALTLPKRCGIDFDLIAACEALARTPAMAPAPVEHKPPHKLPHSPSTTTSVAAASAPGTEKSIMTQMSSQGWWLVAVLTAALASSTAAQGGGSSQGASCASKLTGCVDYINGTRTPPPECCGPLTEAVTNERECLCNIYNDTTLLQAFHINITQALNLPKLCHIDTGKNANICEDEEQIVIIDDEEDNAKDEQIALYMLGRLHTKIAFNAKAMKSALRIVWKPAKGIVIRDLDVNLFVFQFFNQADKAYALNEGPWGLDGHLLLLK
ncbi:hypothetical protein Cgig2_011819 [Carnegiea gigantea]|uniref:Bifunctional inhibitor/plant lipid transfer protein/seed storage helical domain-containing protein n=1 Tax=Carnegiea gigantea TaxID=171969 RepID=A0A9Q1JX30_9CARY|nr:hypothetical protein Cgig2_011819 [Carnegiea gigantea]